MRMVAQLIATKNPAKFHHNHDTDGNLNAKTIFAAMPAINALIARRCGTPRKSIAIKKMANIGPFSIELTLFTASRTVGAMAST